MNLFHGAEMKEAVLVTGDNTVMAFVRHSSGRDNYILLDVDDKRIVCDSSVSRWLPSAAAQHLSKLSQTVADKTAVPSKSPASSTTGKRTKKKQ